MIPEANPSMPSIKFIELVKPMTHNIVIMNPNKPKSILPIIA